MTKKKIYVGISVLFSLILLIRFINFSTLQANAGEPDGFEAFRDSLTSEEKDYLKETSSVTVVCSARKGPLQYLSGDGELKGISLDLLDAISAVSGLQFNTVPMDGLQNTRDMINSGQAQMLSGVPLEDIVRDTYDVKFSDVYLDCSYGVALKRGDSLHYIDTLTIALSDGIDLPEAFQDVLTVKRYSSVEDCLRAVNNEEADFAYGNSYVLEFYSQGYEMQNLCIVPLHERMQPICFGVYSQVDERLLSILNKAIDALGHEKILEITVANVAVSTQPITVASVISSNPVYSMVIMTLVFALIIIISVQVIRNYRNRNRLTLMEHQHYLLVSAAARDYFFEYQCRTDTLTLSEDLAELFGCSQVIHKWKINTLRQDISPANANQLTFILKTHFSKETSPKNMDLREEKLITSNGEECWFRIALLGIFEKEKLSCIIGKLSNIQDEYEEKEALRQKSLCDGLTSLYNIVAVRETINNILKENHHGTFFMIDLDYFKNVNDQYGHQKGDQVLVSFSDVLKTVFRTDDVIGRIGGDEFAVYIQNNDSDSFIINKCNLIKELAAKVSVKESYTLTASIGVAKATAASTFDSLYYDADIALYEVKKTGRDGFKIS